MPKEQIGSIVRTLLTAGSGISLGLLVERFDVTPETLQAFLEMIERLIGSMQGLLSLLGIVVAQGWSLYQKMQKSEEIKLLKNEEAHYND